MRSRRPERPAPRIPISEAVPGRRPPAGGDGQEAEPTRRGANGTVVALAIGVLLMAAALLLPSSEPSDAVPGDALQPVAAVEPDGGEGVDLGDLSRGSDTSVAPDDGAWAALDEAPTTPTTPGRAKAARGGPSAEEGSSSASVAGDDLGAAVRAETKRATERSKAAAARKRSKARQRARARTKARQRARARQRTTAPSRSSGSTAAPPASAPTPAPVQAAPPARSAPRPSAPRRSGGSKGSVRKEFGGGL